MSMGRETTNQAWQEHQDQCPQCRGGLDRPSRCCIQGRPLAYDEAYQRWKDHTGQCRQCTHESRGSELCPQGQRLTFYTDTRHIKTRVGPYPPSRPRESETYIWSTCTRCGWYACHNEYRDCMEHTIAVSDHARDGCQEQGQQSLFPAA